MDKFAGKDEIDARPGLVRSEKAATNGNGKPSVMLISIQHNIFNPKVRTRVAISKLYTKRGPAFISRTRGFVLLVLCARLPNGICKSDW